MQGEGTTCTAEEDIELSTLTAKRYGLQLNIVDLQQEYHNRVTAYVVERVKRGLTPNPDVMCNRLIKFGAFEEKAGYAYDYIATGHYAQTYHDADGQLYLAPAPDPVKDQSDFLSQLTDVQAQKLCFPIGHLLKQRCATLPTANIWHRPTAATARASASLARLTTTTTCACCSASAKAR